MASEADQAVRLLAGFVQLPQAGKLPTCSEICRRALVAVRFLFVKYTAAQARSNADDTIELMVADELAPLTGDVQLVLCAYNVGRGAMYAVLIEEDPNDFMPTCDGCFAEPQCAS